MHRLARAATAFALAVVLVVPSAASARVEDDLPTGLAVMVNGRPLTAAPQVRGSRLFLPLYAIARLLGDVVQLDPLAQRVTVRRQTGVIAALDVLSGEVREDDVVVLVSQGTPRRLAERPEDVELPSEVAAALLGATVVVDRPARAVRVSRLGASAGAPATVARGLAELYQADYHSRMALAGSASAAPSVSWSLQSSAAGRLHDGLFASQVSLNGDDRVAPVQLRRLMLALDRPRHQRWELFDFASGQDLRFIALPVRGASIARPLGPSSLGRVFVGATRSDVDDDGIDAERHDTLLTGWSLSLGRERKTFRPEPLAGAVGGMAFFGPTRRGGLVTGGARYSSGRLALSGELGLGGFRGTQLGGSQVAGLAVFTDLRALVRPVSTVSAQAELLHVGKNFLLPLGGGAVRPMTLVGGSLGWAPVRWAEGRVRGRFIDRLDLGGGRDYDLAGSLSLRPALPLPTLTLSHTQSWRGDIGESAYTLAALDAEWGRWQLSADFSRNQQGNADALLFGSIGLGARLLRVHYLQLIQTVSSGANFGGALNWRGQPMFGGRAQLGAGFGYNYSGGGQTSFYGRLQTRFKLPWRQNLDLTYQHNDFGYQLMLSLSGPLHSSPHRGARGVSELELRRLRQYGNISGRVYQDRDLDGRFDPAVDQGTPGVQVQVDGTHFVLTAADGSYSARRVKLGKHEVQLNLETVRADLTFLDGLSRTVGLSADRDVVVDFRLVRSGGASGTLWIDANDNGRFDEGEEPVSDVRVLTGSGKDTLTDPDGSFLLADLPPGTHVFLLDQKTLPEGVEPARSQVNVEIKSGKTASGADFPLRRVTQQIEVKDFSEGDAE